MKLGALTLRARVVVAVTEPEVPVIVRVVGPTGAVPAAVSVSVLEPMVGFGEKDAVTPLGRPVTERFTLPVNPYCGFTMTVVVPVVPWPSDTLE